MRRPGLGALWLRAVMDAIWQHIIGWDWSTREATEKPRVHGIPVAATESTEEQTRKRNHAHCLVWMKGATELLDRNQSTDSNVSSRATKQLAETFDRTASAKCWTEQIPCPAPLLIPELVLVSRTLDLPSFPRIHQQFTAVLIVSLKPQQTAGLRCQCNISKKPLVHCRVAKRKTGASRRLMRDQSNVCQASLPVRKNPWFRKISIFFEQLHCKSLHSALNLRVAEGIRL